MDLPEDEVTYSMWSRNKETGEEMRESLWDSSNLFESQNTVHWMNTESQIDYRRKKFYFLVEARKSYQKLS